ncbi:MAG: MarR family transcriptional regulator [Alphaproteobacteria bacterium]|nr:MarR family transcriptional regulator [Alphaproteobacteria bacterium]
MKKSISHPSQDTDFDNQLVLIYASLRLLLSFYGKLVKPFDLTYTQYLILSILQHKKESLMSEVSEGICLDSGTLTPVLKTLEEKKLVKKLHVAEDKRQRLLSLTEKGMTLISEINKQLQPILNQFQLKEKEVTILKKMLAMIKEKDTFIEIYNQK